MKKLLKKIKKKIKRIVYQVLYSVAKLCYRILSTFFCRKRVLFMSFSGKQYSCNPKAVSVKLHEISPKTKQIWLFDNPIEKKHIVPNYVKCKKRTAFNTLFYSATSKVWIDNDYFVYKWFLADFERKKKHFFIETWHGDRGLKKCFYAVPGYSRKKPFSIEKKWFCDYFLVGSSFAENCTKEQFHYEGKFLSCGYPRNDCLVNIDEERVKKAKDILGVDYNTKILLYAPTFKGKIKDNEVQEHINFNKVLSTLEKTTNQKWILVYRAHHINFGKELPKSRKPYDGSTNFEDMADILCASDMLITDYSSCAGDFILTGKPTILYINDYDAYETKDRGTFFDIRKSPYYFARNNMELLRIIKNFTPENAKENCQKVKDFYGCTETGKSTEIVCDLIMENLKCRKK